MYYYFFSLPKNDKNRGCVYLPHKESARLPVMIYCQGFGSALQPKRVMEDLLDFAVNKKKMAFVVIDLYGCGGYNPRQGEYAAQGNPEKMTYARWKDNLSDVFSWVKAKKFSDNSKIGFYAYGTATAAALRFAAESDELAYLISTGTCATDHIGMGNGGPAKLLSDNIKKLQNGETVEFMGINFGLDFFIDAVSNAPVHNISEINCPLLFLQGETDNPYRKADALVAFELIKLMNPDTKSKHITFEGGDYCLYNVKEKAVEEVFAWLDGIGVLSSD